MSGNLLNTPSDGLSEVLATIKSNGRAIPFARLVERVQWEWGIGTDTAAEFPTTLATVLGTLQTDGYVDGTTSSQGGSVDLTAGVPAGTTLVFLTQAGIVNSRSLSPKPLKDPWGGH